MKNVNIRLNTGAIILGLFAVISWASVKIATMITEVKSQNKLLCFIGTYTGNCFRRIEKLMDME